MSTEGQTVKQLTAKLDAEADRKLSERDRRRNLDTSESGKAIVARMDGEAAGLRWAIDQLVALDVGPQEGRDGLEEAARKVLASVISSGSGPVAPVFDAHDAQVERERGRWSVIDQAALDALRSALQDRPRPYTGRTIDAAAEAMQGLDAFCDVHPVSLRDGLLHGFAAAFPNCSQPPPGTAYENDGHGRQVPRDTPPSPPPAGTVGEGDEREFPRWTLYICDECGDYGSAFQLRTLSECAPWDRRHKGRHGGAVEVMRISDHNAIVGGLRDSRLTKAEVRGKLTDAAQERERNHEQVSAQVIREVRDAAFGEEGSRE